MTATPVRATDPVSSGGCGLYSEYDGARVTVLSQSTYLCSDAVCEKHTHISYSPFTQPTQHRDIRRVCASTHTHLKNLRVQALPSSPRRSASASCFPSSEICTQGLGFRIWGLGFKKGVWSVGEGSGGVCHCVYLSCSQVCIYYCDYVCLCLNTTQTHMLLVSYPGC